MPPAIQVRPARDDPQDCRVFFEARNDPTSRRNSRNGEPIDFDDHRKWYSAAVNDGQRHLYVVEVDGRPVGYCRVEGPQKEVSIALLPNARGRGVGGEALRILVELFTGSELTAVIGADNPGSRAIFARAGFRQGGRTGRWERWSRLPSGSTRGA